MQLDEFTPNAYRSLLSCHSSLDWLPDIALSPCLFPHQTDWPDMVHPMTHSEMCGWVLLAGWSHLEKLEKSRNCKVSKKMTKGQGNVRENHNQFFCRPARANTFEMEF